MPNSIGSRASTLTTLYKYVTRFDRKGKLVLRFVGPFNMLKHVDKVAYQLTTLMSIDHIHNMFHVLLLCKYISNLTYVLRVKISSLRIIWCIRSAQFRFQTSESRRANTNKSLLSRSYRGINELKGHIEGRIEYMVIVFITF